MAIGKISIDTTHRAVPWAIAELLVALCFYIVYSCHVSAVLCHSTVFINSRIFNLVLQLYEGNELKSSHEKLWRLPYNE